MQSYIGKAGLCFLLLPLLISLANAKLPEKDQNFQTTDWVALIPKDDLDALLNPPDFLSDIADSSDQDSVDLLQKNTKLDAQGKRFQEALVSTTVVSEYDGKSIRIPGFIVPLESANERMVTEFFIVPYFGACLHMPPPPPNQIIHVVVNEGIELENLYDPFWFEGRLALKIIETETGLSAYSMTLHQVIPYQEPNSFINVKLRFSSDKDIDLFKDSEVILTKSSGVYKLHFTPKEMGDQHIKVHITGLSDASSVDEERHITVRSI